MQVKKIVLDFLNQNESAFTVIFSGLVALAIVVYKILTQERWFHITEEHSEMAGYHFEVLETVEEPEAIYEEAEDGKNIVAVYRELNKEDGFVITAFLTRRKKQFERRRKIWKQ